MKNTKLNTKNSCLFLCLLALCWIFQLQADETRIVVFGDSLSAGYQIPVEKSWVALVAERLQEGIEVANASVSGITTRNGLKRFDTLLNGGDYTHLILELAANDGLRGYRLNSMQKNLQKMVEMARDKGMQVMYLGIRLPENYGSYATAHHESQIGLMQKLQVQLVPFFLEPIYQDIDNFLPDGLHPNEQGHELIADYLLPEIQNWIDKE